jgi:uncharacterized protein YpmB
MSNGSTAGNAIIIFFVIILLIIIFLLIRELCLWYWKINENTENFRRIANSLEELVSLTKKQEENVYNIKKDENKESSLNNEDEK